MFVRHSAIKNTDVGEINPSDTSMHKPLSEVNLGGKCEAKLIDEPLGTNTNRFRQDCLAFLIELCIQIRKRFDLTKGCLLDLIGVTEPKVALSQQRAHSLINVAIKFRSSAGDLDRLDDEWQSLLLRREEFETIESLPAEHFWEKVRDTENGIGEKPFQTLGQFMVHLMSLPHSTAAVERIFSLVNGLKTKDTNRLYVSTLMNRLLARQHVVRRGGNCNTWVPSTELVSDVSGGYCHQRYKNSLQQNRDDQRMVLHYDIYDDDDDHDD
jgi:hypothetical protein